MNACPLLRLEGSLNRYTCEVTQIEQAARSQTRQAARGRRRRRRRRGRRSGRGRGRGRGRSRSRSRNRFRRRSRSRSRSRRRRMHMHTTHRDSHTHCLYIRAQLYTHTMHTYIHMRIQMYRVCARCLQYMVDMMHSGSATRKQDTCLYTLRLMLTADTHEINYRHMSTSTTPMLRHWRATLQPKAYHKNSGCVC